MTDIPQFKDWKTIDPIDKGWSTDRKYCIETKTGEKILLRLADISEYDRKQMEFNAIKKLDGFDCLMSRPLDFGVCNEGKSVYSLVTWIEGKDAEIVLPSLTENEQYKLGIFAGELLKKIHSIPAPENQISWSKRFN